MVRAQAQAFVHVVEVWVPDRNVLRHRSGAYGKHTDYAKRSVTTTYRRGEGLPGAAWASGRVVVWQELRKHLVRGESAHEHGLDAGVAIPIYRGEALTSVLVILCGEKRRAGGCIEVWEPTSRNELAHAGAYYGRLEESMGEVSRAMRFARGVGLPGVTWQRGTPFLIEALQTADVFQRSALAAQSGLCTGLGIPLYRGGDLAQVLLLLSAQSSPIARAYEVWVPDALGHLRLDQAVYGKGLDRFGVLSRSTMFAPGEGLPGKVAQSGQPVVFGNIQVGPFIRHRAAEEAGLEVGVGI
ncbi:MAG TPA: hypothetical protein VHM19_06130, partial [Polyangiales bacterium]|nr:hypothetical protein [Polyangiales bacterium]